MMSKTVVADVKAVEGKNKFVASTIKDFKLNKYVYLMAVPVLAYYLVFCYAPMYGLVIAFKNFTPSLGILESPWVGLRYFRQFIDGIYFWRLIRNTLLINIYDVLFHFPAPILFAVLLNEITSSFYKRTVQTLTYLPHFISLVVVAGMITEFTASKGVVNQLIGLMGGEASNLLARPELFRAIYVISGIWKEVGWESIIYLAALTSINPEIYEAAKIDGAGRLKQMLCVTLPGIAPTISILFILRMGSMMNVGWEKIILLYNPLTYETADVISSFVYRYGLLESNFSYTAAVGLFNAVINFILIICTNELSKKFQSTALW